MKTQQIISTIVYLFTVLNGILTAVGKNPLPFSESDVYTWVTIILSVVVFAYGVWKNYPTSKEGKTADKVLHAMKSGIVAAQDVLNLIDLKEAQDAINKFSDGTYENEDETGGYAAGMLFSGRNRVTQPYTYNVNTKQGHGGIDIVGDDDKTVHAVEGGTVSMVSVWDGKTKTGTQSYGNLVVITDATGKRHFYAHLASISMRKGQRVSAGDVVGVMGNTGNSFGAHTHYEVRTGQGTVTRINPAEFCGVRNEKGTYVNNVSASPAPSHRGTAYTMTCKMLYVRKGPSVRYRRVGQFSRGEIFYVVARQGNWCQLESGNWMCAGKYLKRV